MEAVREAQHRLHELDRRRLVEVRPAAAASVTVVKFKAEATDVFLPRQITASCTYILIKNRSLTFLSLNQTHRYDVPEHILSLLSLSLFLSVYIRTLAPELRGQREPGHCGVPRVRGGDPLRVERLLHAARGARTRSVTGLAHVQFVTVPQQQRVVARARAATPPARN